MGYHFSLPMVLCAHAPYGRVRSATINSKFSIALKKQNFNRGDLNCVANQREFLHCSKCTLYPLSSLGLWEAVTMTPQAHLYLFTLYGYRRSKIITYQDHCLCTFKRTINLNCRGKNPTYTLYSPLSKRVADWGEDGFAFNYGIVWGRISAR